MNSATLVRRETVYARKALLRDPQNLFFTAGLPLLYLFIFATIFGDEIASIAGQTGELDVATVHDRVGDRDRRHLGGVPEPQRSR